MMYSAILTACYKSETSQTAPLCRCAYILRFVSPHGKPLGLHGCMADFCDNAVCLAVADIRTLFLHVCNAKKQA